MGGGPPFKTSWNSGMAYTLLLDAGGRRAGSEGAGFRAAFASETSSAPPSAAMAAGSRHADQIYKRRAAGWKC